jgi:hypothetical protein
LRTTQEELIQQQRGKPINKALQPPPWRTIQATDSEVIILQAALHHYQDFIRPNEELYKQVAPHIQAFIERLHNRLPQRSEQVNDF